MPRAFTSADVVQGVTDAAAVATLPGATLPAATTEGYGGMMVLGAGASLVAPEQWDIVAYGGVAGFPQLVIMCRACIPAGETTWPFAVAGGATTNWTWRAEEWTNLSYAPIIASADHALVGAPASATIGPTVGDFTVAPHVMAVAAVFLHNGTAGGSVWPTLSWSDGFTETESVSIGHNNTHPPTGGGANAGDEKLHVAVRYGTLNEAGPWSTTVTFTGSMTNKNVYRCMAVFRAESYEGEA